MKKKLAVVVAALLVLALALPAYAVNFVPSIEQKEDPSVIQQENKDGEQVDFLAYDEQGNELDPAEVADVELVITPLSQKDSAFDSKVTDSLTAAESDVKGASTLADLSSDVTSALENAIKEDSSLKGLEVSDLTVSDLFNASLKKGDAYTTFADAGIASMKVSFKTDSPINLVLFRGEDGTWQVLDSTLADGVITVTLPSNGTIALVKEGTGSSDDSDGSGSDDGETSPQTGYESNSGIFTAVAICSAVVAAVGTCVLVSSKRK